MFLKESDNFLMIFSPLKQEVVFQPIEELKEKHCPDSFEDSLKKAQLEFESLCWEFFINYGQTTEPILGTFFSPLTYGKKVVFPNQKRTNEPSIIQNYKQKIEHFKQMSEFEKADFLDYFYKQITP
jgi:hypothetical protein